MKRGVAGWRPGAAAQLMRKTTPVSFHGCMQDPVERAGSAGAWEVVARSYAARRTSSTSGNGTSGNYFCYRPITDPERRAAYTGARFAPPSGVEK